MDQPSLIAARLKELRQDAEKALNAEPLLTVKHQLALWLFLYHESSDVLVHSQLVHPTDDTKQEDPIVKNSQILGGLGTIGFVLRTGKTEVVADTLGDPRGTVAVQDSLIGNYSWCGVPIKSSPQAITPVGVVSFFPVALSPGDPAHWPEDEVGREIIRRLLQKFVDDHIDRFLIICELALRTNANHFLTHSFTHDQGAIFESEISTMLRRLLSLGASYDKMPYLAYVEREDEGLEAAYICSAAPYLRCDIERLRVELLESVQWRAINLPDGSDSDKLVGERIAVLPLIIDAQGENAKVLLRLHLRTDGRRLIKIIAEVFGPWRPVLSAIYERYSAGDDRRQRKVLAESAANLFGLLARSVLSDRTHQGLQTLVKETKDQLRRLLEFLIERYQLDIPEGERLIEHLGYVVSHERDLAATRSEIIALSLWHELEDWIVVEQKGFNENDLDKLKAPGNWRVLQYAAASEEVAGSISDTYRMINWTDDIKYVKKEQTICTISWNQYEVSFSRGRFYFPLDLQLCALGFAHHLFEAAEISPLAIAGTGEDLKSGRAVRSADTNDPRLRGWFRVLATDEKERRGIVIGPWEEASKEVDFEARQTLEQFAKKELHVVLLNEYAGRVTEASRRAAVAAIMARNASHNIGSHVLARHAVRNIEKQSRSIRGARLRAISAELLTFRKKRGLVERLRGELKDAQCLERYLQGRMDFVAQISTEWPQWTEAARLTGEVLWGFLAQRLVLEEIVASEGIGALEWEQVDDGWLAHSTGRDGEIRLSCMGMQRNDWMPPCGKDPTVEDRMLHGETYLMTKPLRDRLWHSQVSLKHDPLISIPGGVTGWHAFYVIVENVIRNAAKHGNWEAELRDHHATPLDVVIEVLEDESQTQVSDADHGVTWSHAGALVRIYDNISKATSELVNRINSSLNKPVIDGNGRLRREHWGLAEMKIAAAYLQRRPIERLGGTDRVITGDLAKALVDDGQGTALIRAVCSPLNTLGYEFFVLKPRSLGVSSGPGE